ncbi:RNA ligase family protein [Brevibacillus laterosporus]|uniref:ATP-dependent DNA ligase n=1 Tax=Brevibacillus laterosporus TaxID=1465 RepID=UPI00215CFBBD|nr:RNA ligase family protein [Brevibacillus laterosporus]MCR8994728.1 ATP-dependent DNA ligase [Brevibacillus laterosporus]
MLKNIVAIFKEIQATSSRTGKEAILRANEKNEEFRFLLKFLYNPFDLTGIGTKKLKKFADYKANEDDDLFLETFENVFDLIRWLRWHKTGSDEAVKTVANFINKHEDTEVHDFLQELITKKFKCGITASTINKVYDKGTIPEFDVMLAKKFEEEEHKIKGTFYVTLKFDGIRCVAIKRDGVVNFFTRQGQPVEGLAEIEQEITEKLPDNFVYDGELLLRNSDNLPSDELFRATQKVVRKDGEKKNVLFHIFDALPVEEFLAGKSSKTYEVRRQNLDEMFHDVNYSMLKIVPVLYSGTDKSEIFKLLNQVVAQGMEGLMVNNGNAYYVAKRSDALLKVKKMHTVDLQVIGLEEGTGKNKGTLGALVVDYKGYEVKVGSGFTDGERNIIWNTMQKSIIGQIIEVQYFEESSNQDGGISLRFPVFKRIRDDKVEPSLH